ncbi:MAG: hypothetical protein QOF89_2357 [Acidobacteriota bacterium]|jgi:uncharacterized membrane protein|nr:hypothetical protein [Acidobacteriota bacterium]
MGGLGVLVIGILLVNAWLTRRRLKDLEVTLQAEKESHSGLLRRIIALEKIALEKLALEKARAQAGPDQPSVTAASPIPAAAPVPPPPPPVVAPAVVHAAMPPPLPPAQPQVARPTAPPPLPPSPRPQLSPPPKTPHKPFDWESLVGVKLFSWIAGILFALTAITFLRYSIDHGWLRPPIRMAMGLVMGAGLLGLCEHRVARRYAITANALGAAGIVTLFSTFFAAHTQWHLLGPVPTFILMVLVTAVAVGLSIRHDALFIALLGLVGGFATPALLSTGEDHPIGLFGYLLLLNAGLAWVALRKSWPVLSILSLAFTALYQWGWVFRFLDASKLPLALGIFLVFPLLAFLVPAFSRGPTQEKGNGEARNILARTAAVGACLPLVFGLYLAAIPAYGARYGLLFGFLFVLQAGLAAVAAFRGPRALHPLAAGTAVLSFALWFGTSYNAEAWPAALGFVVLFVLFELAAPWLANRLGRPLGEEGRLGALAGPLLLFSFPVLFYLEPAAAAPGLPFAVLFALLAAVAGFALLYEDGRLFSISAFFAVAAEAVWSARSLTPERLLPGISIYAVFGLLYLGVPVLARRLNRRLPPAGSGAFLLLLSLGLLFFLAAGPLAQASLWGLALLLVILNAGLFLEAGTLRRPLLALAGTVLSWLLIGVWWATVPLAASLVPALFLVAGFSVLGLAGNVWMRQQQGQTGMDGLGGGQYLALVGHAFLLVVAVQPRLSIPPWPFLGVLLVLDLAVGVAALWLRRASLWIAALAASDLVLLAWVLTARDAPWPAIALASALAVSALGFLWIVLARRVADNIGELSELAANVASGAIASLFLGQIVAITAAMVQGAPPLAFTVLAHVAFLIAILFLSVHAARPWLAPLSIIFTTAAVAGWRLDHLEGAPWWHELAFAAALYLLYLAFPLILGERSRRLRQPYLAAVLASLSFFLLARHALIAGGFSGEIGALPVAQAIALAVLLTQLVRMERRAPEGVAARRDPGRLALVAGAVLACVTAAIPLQLNREWITLGWALLAAALAALYLRIPHRGLLAWIAGLLAAVFVRLVANPAVLTYHPRGDLAIWNWYLYTYLVPALAFFLAAWLLARGDDRLAEPPLPRLSTLAASGAVVLLFLMVNIEIADFFSRGASLTFSFLTGQATLAEDLAYTLAWAVFAIALFVAGVVKPLRGVRIAAIVLLLVAVLKGFVHDMARLGGLYRVGSFAGLGICLAVMAVLIQKYVLPRREAE